MHEAYPLPRVLAVGPHRHPHVGAGGEVESPKAGPVHDWGDLQHLAGGQPGGAPQALVAVPERDVEKLDLTHEPPPSPACSGVPRPPAPSRASPRCSGRLVSSPVISHRPSARRSLLTAPGRSAPHAMSLARRGS